MLRFSGARLSPGHGETLCSFSFVIIVLAELLISAVNCTGLLQFTTGLSFAILHHWFRALQTVVGLSVLHIGLDWTGYECDDIPTPKERAISLRVGLEDRGRWNLASGKRRFERWMKGSVILLALLSLTGCGSYAESTFHPEGPVARAQLFMTELSFWIMVFVSVVVASGLVYVIVKFRERPGQTGEPPQVEGNHKLELAWTIGPIILLAILAVVTLQNNYALSGPSPKRDALRVQVIGHQFWWEFDYPSLGLETANELHIPVGRPVDLLIQSSDVVHSFWIPELGGKLQAIPGRTNIMWFQADQPGIYSGACAEFCGTSHAFMHMAVDAQSPADFSKWVNGMQHPESQPVTALARKGYEVFGQVGCTACHSIAGTPYTYGHIGPNLTDLSDRLQIAAFTLANTPENLAIWLHNPPAVKPGTKMPNLHLAPAQIKALVAYLEALR